MKKFIYKALAFAIASVASCMVYSASAAVEEYDMKVSAFNAIEVGSDFAVSVKKGSTHSVKVVLDSQFKSYVQTPVNNGILSVYLEDKKMTSDQKKLLRSKGEDKPSFKVVITVPAGDLNKLTLNADSTLESFDNVENSKIFILTVNDNAVVADMAVKAESVEVELSKKGTAKLGVKADKLKLTAGGNSSVDLNQNVTESELNMNANSSLTLDGKADTMTITAKATNKSVLKGSADFVYYNVSGTANVDALALKTEDANVVMNSICTLKEAATKSLTISIAAGANLVYANSPAITITGIKLSTVSQYQAESK